VFNRIRLRNDASWTAKVATLPAKPAQADAERGAS
jgi:hypothetical protein